MKIQEFNFIHNHGTITKDVFNYEGYTQDHWFWFSRGSIGFEGLDSPLSV